MAEKPNILIAVPCRDRSIDVETSGLLVSLALFLREQGAGFSIKHIFGADLCQMRNAYASIVLERPSLTHLLFIDSDMGVRAEAVARLLAANKDIIGLACPKRNLELTWSFRAKTVNSVNGIAEVEFIGMGVTLIKRGVLEHLSKIVRIDRKHRFEAQGLKGDLFGFFDYIHEPEWLSEDYSLCKRWRDSGGSIYMLTNEMVRHIGPHAFAARLSDEAMAKPQAQSR